MGSSFSAIMSKSAEQWKLDGNAAVKEGDHARAFEMYSKGLEVEPDHAILLSNRSHSLIKLGRFEEAAADAQRCVSLRPDFVKGYLRCGMALQELGRPQQALQLLCKSPKDDEVEKLVAKVRPQAEDAEARRIASLSGAEKKKEEGNALFKKGLFEQAVVVYSQALELCSEPSSDVALAIRNNRAGCYHQLSDFKQVVEETSFVLTHEPENLKALMRRMIAYEPLEKYEAALQDARQVLRHAPANEAANKVQHRLGKLLRDQERMGDTLVGA